MQISRKPQSPDFREERKHWKRGYQFVAGVDEVGRGCFAGPVVAAAVAFAPMANGKWLMVNKEGIKINDSKKLTSRQRERADKWIKENALSWGIGEVPVSVINRLGMAKATKMAFRKAISEARERLGMSIDFLLVDAFFIPYVRGNPKDRQLAIVDGDEKSISIGAASIIAKVYRDRLMVELGKKPKFSKYGWGKNKGYGTKEHQLAIKKYGITRYHRKAFVKNFA